MRFELFDREAVELREAMCTPLRTYNREKNPGFFAAREEPGNAVKHLYIVLYDDAGEIAGGLIGESQFKWLKVEILSVREDLRGRGLGTRLMQVAEEEALRRGCKYVYLDTASYQAPEFYRRLGYTVAAEIADWDSHGNAKFFFTKTLLPPD